MARLIIEAGLIIGILVISILVFYHRKHRNRNNYFLAGSMLSIWFSLFVNNLNDTGEILNYPFLARTGNIAAYMIFPFIYLYTRNTFYPGKLWKSSDFIFLIPALFYIIDMVPFFFSPAEEKVAQMKLILKDRQKMFRVSEGWIAINGLHFVLRYLWGLSVMGLQIRLLYRNWNIVRADGNTLNRPLRIFLLVFTALHLPLIIPGIFGALLHLPWFTLRYLNMNLAIVLIATALFTLLHPRILYGFLPMAQKADKDPVTAPAKLPNLTDVSVHQDADIVERIGERELHEMVTKMESFMVSSRPFTLRDYTIHDLSRDIDIPVYQLSPIINSYYNSNFNTWMNKFRVEHFIRISQEEGRKELTLDAIAREAGFFNRTTFTNAFKKEKGTTPGQYLKTLTSVQ